MCAARIPRTARPPQRSPPWSPAAARPPCTRSTRSVASAAALTVGPVVSQGSRTAVSSWAVRPSARAWWRTRRRCTGCLGTPSHRRSSPLWPGRCSQTWSDSTPAQAHTCYCRRRLLPPPSSRALCALQAWRQRMCELMVHSVQPSVARPGVDWVAAGQAAAVRLALGAAAPGRREAAANRLVAAGVLAGPAAIWVGGRGEEPPTVTVLCNCSLAQTLFDRVFSPAGCQALTAPSAAAYTREVGTAADRPLWLAVRLLHH